MFFVCLIASLLVSLVVDQKSNILISFSSSSTTDACLFVCSLYIYLLIYSASGAKESPSLFNCSTCIHPVVFFDCFCPLTVFFVFMLGRVTLCIVCCFSSCSFLVTRSPYVGLWFLCCRLTG